MAKLDPNFKLIRQIADLASIKILKEYVLEAEQALSEQPHPSNDRDEIKRLRDALQALYDGQNGPPLLRDEVSWQAAMDKAEEYLKEKPNE